MGMDFGAAPLIAFDVLDLLGAFAFGLSGALVAVRRDFDVVGIAVLACCTAFGGGLIRDVLIGDIPPVAFTDLRYLVTALVAALVVFLWHPPERVRRVPLTLVDAMGLGLYCVTGAVKAASFGLGPVPSALMGVTTAVGGGMLRDVLAGLQPSVLRRDSELYALPALVGAGAASLLFYTGAYNWWTGALAALGAIVLRLLAVRYHWSAPRALRRQGGES
ncbi:putative membrane protein YeiH [Nocardiopsis composta]|uniref:Putative membrane protein YeiH n=2 Tax=Nocardiopsis composta TaxID=157465 RepID=A0A7W8QGX6_9ACTN|nr:putative membrane protein YeiH [Nocardiopsis composta]